jgi:uroporphyrinogen decarboxylase
MTGRERFESILRGEAPDRIPFVPSVYEHGASLLGKTPSQVCRDTALMARAALSAYDTYRHDLVTVGIDCYNVEPEAWGCELSYNDESAVPGILTHPLDRQPELDAGGLQVPRPGGGNRLQIVADASARVQKEIGDQVWVYGVMSGPFSQAVELRGFEKLLQDMIEHPGEVERLMAKTTELCVEQGRRFARQGCGAYMSESWATLPLISPDIFRRFVVPFHKQIIAALRGELDTPPPAVIMGGDTSILVDFLLEAGSAYMVADYNTDFEHIRKRIAGRDMIVRGCVDTKLVEKGDWPAITRGVRELARKKEDMVNFVWGCGCVSQNTPPEHVLRFKEICLAGATP